MLYDHVRDAAEARPLGAQAARGGRAHLAMRMCIGCYVYTIYIYIYVYVCIYIYICNTIIYIYIYNCVIDCMHDAYV